MYSKRILFYTFALDPGLMRRDICQLIPRIRRVNFPPSFGAKETILPVYCHQNFKMLLLRTRHKCRNIGSWLITLREESTLQAESGIWNPVMDKILYLVASGKFNTRTLRKLYTDYHVHHLMHFKPGYILLFLLSSISFGHRSLITNAKSGIGRILSMD